LKVSVLIIHDDTNKRMTKVVVQMTELSQNNKA